MFRALRTCQLDICSLPTLCQELLKHWTKVSEYLLQNSIPQGVQGVRKQVGNILITKFGGLGSFNLRPNGPWARLGISSLLTSALILPMYAFNVLSRLMVRTCSLVVAAAEPRLVYGVRRLLSGQIGALLPSRARLHHQLRF